MWTGVALLRLYVPLMIWVGLGLILGRFLPNRIPNLLGQGLFWFGVPVGIMTFIRQADLSGGIWVAPIVAWVAVALGAGLAWLWIQIQANPPTRGILGFAGRQRGRQAGQADVCEAWVEPNHPIPSSAPEPARRFPFQGWSRPSQGSFLNAAMFGNTGYLGYPVVLALVGPKYFGWAVFYDTLGSTLAAYGLGVAMASNFGVNRADPEATHHVRRTLVAVTKNPAMWSFWIGLAGRQVVLPTPLEQGLRVFAWSVIGLSLLLLGMRLSQISSWGNLRRAIASLGIKMVIVPLLVALVITGLGMSGPQRLVLVLQVAMPPAFATLILAEAYNLDRELTVTTLAVGSIAILLTLPLWLSLFGT